MRLAVGLLLALVMTTAPVPAAAQATYNADVPAGKWKGVRLNNLPKGVAIELLIKTSGDVGVVVTDLASYRRFPNIGRPLFRARIVTRVRVTVTMPEPGDYVVVLDNRAGGESRQVEISAGVRRGREQPGGASPPRPEPRRGGSET